MQDNNLCGGRSQSKEEHRGTIGFLPDGGAGTQLRHPEDHTGPPWGPWSGLPSGLRNLLLLRDTDRTNSFSQVKRLMGWRALSQPVTPGSHRTSKSEGGRPELRQLQSSWIWALVLCVSSM